MKPESFDELADKICEVISKTHPSCVPRRGDSPITWAKKTLSVITDLQDQIKFASERIVSLEKTLLESQSNGFKAICENVVINPAGKLKPRRGFQKEIAGEFTIPVPFDMDGDKRAPSAADRPKNIWNNPNGGVGLTLLPSDPIPASKMGPEHGFNYTVPAGLDDLIKKGESDEPCICFGSRSKKCFAHKGE